MPHVVNGIGTWYWGKNNIVAHTARCEFCGAYQELTSFDTTLYFVVFFLPVIPLKRKRVFDQCPSCKRHRALPLKKWEQQKTESLMKAVEEWQAAPNNPEPAKKAITTAVAFHDKQAFEDMSVPIAQTFARNSEMQLFLGDAFDHFGDAEAADDRYRSALAIRNDPKTRRRYAAFLLRRLRRIHLPPAGAALRRAPVDRRAGGRRRRPGHGNDRAKPRDRHRLTREPEPRRHEGTKIHEDSFS